MWRMYVLARHLRWFGLLEIGLAMLDGSYWQETIYDDRNFVDRGDPSVDFGGGE
jgi:hypothetical protein